MISIVLPTFNRAIEVKRSISSVLKQTYQNFELIIVDDGSTDQTAEVVASLTDQRIRFIKMGANQGANAARNRGIREARGDLIAFQDSDDLWLPTKLEKQVTLFNKASPAVGIISCQYIIPKNDKKGVIYPIGNLTGELFGNSNYLYEGDIGNQTMLVKREVFDNVGFFDEQFPRKQDFEFLLRATTRYRVQFVEEPLVIYNFQREGSISTNTEALFQSSVLFLKKYPDLFLADKHVASHTLFEVALYFFLYENKSKLAGQLFRLSIKYDKWCFITYFRWFVLPIEWFLTKKTWQSDRKLDKILKTCSYYIRGISRVKSYQRKKP